MDGVEVHSESESLTGSVPDRLVGVSAQMQRLYGLVHQASAYSYPVLITGDRGTGKRLVAQTIHSLSQRKARSFVVADFSKLAPTLAEAELFGYERGAFAGASQMKWGLLAYAREGTILLKEVGRLPLHVQEKFVHVLQEKEFRPIGSIQPLPFKARILATTCRDLLAEVKRGAFREDLFARLTPAQISLSPLRERKEDIPLLLDYFLEKYGGRERSKVRFSPAAIQRLAIQDWPGNVRELEETVRGAVSLDSGTVIEIDDLKLAPQSPDDHRWADDLSMYFDERERGAIVEALRAAQGDRSTAARRLGMAESALQKRLEYFHL